MHQNRVFSGAVAAALFAAMCAYVLARFAVGTVSGAVAEDDRDAPYLTLDGVVIRAETVVSAENDCAWRATGGVRTPAGAAVAALATGETIYSASAGVFYADTDGYEYLSPDILSDIDEGGLSTLLGASPLPDDNACGRVITEFCWYYAAFLPEGTSPPKQSTVEVYFPSAATWATGRVMRTITGRRTALILRFTAESAATAHLRFCTAQIAAY